MIVFYFVCFLVPFDSCLVGVGECEMLIKDTIISMFVKFNVHEIPYSNESMPSARQHSSIPAARNTLLFAIETDSY